MTALAGRLRNWFGQGLTQTKEQDSEPSAKGQTATGGSGEQEPVVVWRAANSMEAQIVKGRLLSQDIPAIVRGESLGELYGLTGGRLATTEVLVPAPLAERASAILAGDDAQIDADVGEEE